MKQTADVPLKAGCFSQLIQDVQIEERCWSRATLFVRHPPLVSYLIPVRFYALFRAFRAISKAFLESSHLVREVYSTSIISDTSEILRAFSSLPSHLHNVVVDILDHSSRFFAVHQARSNARSAVGHKAHSIPLCV